MRSYTLTPPSFEPVTLAEAKLAARISGTAFDALLPGLITAARQLAEQHTERRFMQQVVRFELEEWPLASDVFALYRPESIAVSYWDGSAFVSLADGGAVAGIVDGGFVVVPALNTTWPDLGEVAAGARVRMDVTVGTTEAAEVEECVKLFIKALVGYWISNPEAANRVDQRPAPFLMSLLDPVRVYL